MPAYRILLLFAFSGAALAQFPATCPQGDPTLPGPAVAIDDSGGCAVEGTAPTLTGDKLAAELAQNRMKNNFCAQGDPKSITVNDMTKLQSQVTKKNLVTPREPPLDRSGLAALGEGDAVQFSGFVFEARQEGGESVNCGDTSPDVPGSHDIHIALLKSKRKSDPGDKTKSNKEECGSIVAEMSPHHRLPEWSACSVNLVAKQGLKVRVTGQRFFDGSHVACKGSTAIGGQPKRVSVWEIHPIYQFEVCPSGACTDGGWQPLATFMAGKTECQ